MISWQNGPCNPEEITTIKSAQDLDRCVASAPHHRKAPPLYWLDDPSPGFDFNSSAMPDICQLQS